MKRRNLLGAAALCGASVLALASCGGGKSANEIIFYCSAGNTIRPVLDKKVEEFNKTSDYKVKIVNPGDYDPLKEKIKADLKVGNQPAIAYCYPDHVAEYLSGSYKNKVIDLQSRFIANDKDFSNINFIESYYNEGKIFEEGKLYTLPFVKSTEAVFVNMDILKAANVELSELETWEGLFAKGGALDKIKAYNKDLIPLGVDSSDNLFITLCEQYGLPYTAAGTTNETTYLFNNEKVEKMLTDLNKEHQTDKSFSTRAVIGGYTSTKFTTQELAISVGSTGGANHQDPKGAFDYKVLPYPHPAGKEATSVSQGPSLVMFEQTNDEKENAAWAFAKSLFGDDVQTEFPKSSGYMPVTNSAYENAAFQEFLDGESIIAQTINMAQTVKDKLFVSPAFNGSNKAREQVGIALNEALAASPAEASAKIKEALKSAYKECTFFN